MPANIVLQDGLVMKLSCWSSQEVAWQAMACQDRSQECKYVYELPYAERKALCNILDINDQWERLGGEKMGFSIIELSEMKKAERCGDSPTDRLLQIWGRKNNTIKQLYFLLYTIEHFQAMSVLLPFIPQEYHYKRLHDELSTLNLLDPPVKEETLLNFPRPDPSLLVDMRSKSYGGKVTNMNRSVHGQRSVPNGPINSNIDAQSHIGRVIDPRHPSVGDRNAADIGSQRQAEGQPQTTLHSPRMDQIKSMGYSSDESSRTKSTEKIRENVDGKYNSDAPVQQALRAGIMYEESKNASNVEDDGRLLQGQQESVHLRKRHQSDCSVQSSMSESSLPVIPYDELERATSNWDKTNLLGSGGFGSVYKGMWINTSVAIKRMNSSDKDDENSSQINQLMEELRFLQKYRHDNILQVFGFSADAGRPRCLVYQFMSNGSLEYRLQCRKIKSFSDNVPAPLNWKQRFVVAKGTAAALQFLHTVQHVPLIHGDVKSANILLDSYLEPKLGDFGLARELPQSELTSMKVSHVHGTRPYIPDEYLRNKKLSTKVDSYSFGIVMFEICTGRRAYDEKTRKYLKELVLEESDAITLLDPKAGHDSVTVFDILYEIGHKCIQRSPKARPDMPAVYQELERFAKVFQAQERQRRISREDYSYYGLSSQTPSPITFNTSFSTSPSTFLHPNSSLISHQRPMFHPHYPMQLQYRPMPNYPGGSMPPTVGAYPSVPWNHARVKGPSPSPSSKEPPRCVSPLYPTRPPQNNAWTPLEVSPSSPTPSQLPPPVQEENETPEIMIPDISRLIQQSSNQINSDLKSSSSSSDSVQSSDRSSIQSSEFNLELNEDEQFPSSIRNEQSQNKQGFPAVEGNSCGESPLPLVLPEMGEVQQDSSEMISETSCIPLLTQLGIKEEKETKKCVSAEGKKSLFD